MTYRDGQLDGEDVLLKRRSGRVGSGQMRWERLRECSREWRVEMVEVNRISQKGEGGLK